MRNNRYLLATAAPSILLVALAFAQDQTLNQTFQARRLQIETLIGNLKVDVVPGATSIGVSMQGSGEMIQLVRLSASGDTVVIDMDGSGGDWWSSLWDWSTPASGDLAVTVTVPPGTPLSVDHFVGDAVIGDLDADVKFGTNGGQTHFGRIANGEISIAGSGDVTLGDASGRIKAEIAGSGSVHAGNARHASIEIAGGGDVTLGTVNGDLEIDVAGSGDVVAQSVNGRVDIDVAGSGDVTIHGGRADPLKIDIAGSGTVRFAGTANNPDVSVMGSGDVWIATYTGTLSSDGADIKIGQVQ